ncbi:hypothetical protein Ancab_000119 [Ancistrocladus abbreviatus]
MVVDAGGVLTISKSHANVVEDLNVSTPIGMEGIPLVTREAAVARVPSLIERQAARAVEESSLFIFLVEGQFILETTCKQAGLTAADMEIGDWLRSNYSNKNIILGYVNASVSCADSHADNSFVGVSSSLSVMSGGVWADREEGFPVRGTMSPMSVISRYLPIPVSAISGTGTGELLDLVCSRLERIKEPRNLDDEENYVPAIALVGRPNVGKSSILNALVGEDRTIVSPVSGTTRDAIDTEFTGPDGQKFRFIDTAGIRRKAAVASSGSTTEALSVNRAFRAIRHSDVVALVIEAMACITEQNNYFCQ